MSDVSVGAGESLGLACSRDGGSRVAEIAIRKHTNTSLAAITRDLSRMMKAFNDCHSPEHWSRSLQGVCCFG